MNWSDNRNTLGVYVGGVLDMGCQNLHVFIKEEYRRQGHLTRALQEWILPSLFSDGREYQQITYEDEPAKRHALKFGFTEIEEGKGVLTKDNIQERSEVQGHNTSVSEAAYREMRRKIFQAAGLLKMVRDQLEMAYSESGQFDDAIGFVRDLVFQTEDIYLGRYEDG